MAVVISGDQWALTAPVQMQVGVSNRQWDLVRRNLLNIPVNSITFYAIGRGDGPVALDNDLLAIANLTGTNTIYYRAGDGIWSPVVIGSGLSFVGGILFSTGSVTGTLNLGTISGILSASGDGILSKIGIGSGLYFINNTLHATGVIGPDLSAIEALTGINQIYYRSGVNTWSPVTIGTGLDFNGGLLRTTGGSTLDADLLSIASVNASAPAIYYRSSEGSWSTVTLGTGITFSGGTLNINKTSYCLEADIGCIPWDYTSGTATHNTIRLNLALDAMCPSGQFVFPGGVTGPIQKAIVCPGKTYFFNDNLRTNLHVGGELVGAGGGYGLGDGETCSICQGGVQTRFVRINVISGVGGEGQFCFLLRNNGFTLKNIHFFGGQSTSSNINGLTGAKVNTILGIEGRPSISTGRHNIENCNFQYGSTGIRFINGYYDPTGFVTEESHADTTYWKHCIVHRVDTCLKSDSQQALWHTFDHCDFASNSGGHILYVTRGGLWNFNSLGISTRFTTLLTVQDFSPNNNRFDIHFYRDGFGYTGTGTHQLKLFQHVGTGNSYYNWDVRFRGSIGNANEVEYLGEIATFNNVSGGKVWFDVNNIENYQLPTGYQWDVVGPWRRLIPTG